MRNFIAIFITLLFFGSLNAKDKGGVIMTVDGENIPSEEFIYLFHKNNQQQSQPQSIDEYLKLFEIYRLKVAEAKSQGIDTLSNFRKEMNLYKRELLQPYIEDTVFFNTLVDEAVKRDKELVECSHIMIIRTEDEEIDKKNLALLDSIRLELLKGADFAEMAKKYSQDRFSSDKGGYLGFMPAGTYPYAFETAEYETPEGGISEIVESHVGWHLVKPGGRKTTEEMERPAKSYSDLKSEVKRRSSTPNDPRFDAIRDNIIKNLSAKYPKIAQQGLPQNELFRKLLDAEEAYQYENNADYRNLVDEYVNGSLLYEVSVENVWDKAANDPEGLKNYFERNRASIKWDSPHAKGILIQAVNDSIASDVKMKIAQISPDSIVAFVKANYPRQAMAERFSVSEGTVPMIDHLMFGGEPATPRVKGYTTYFVAEGRIVEQPEEVSDVKGLVTSGYQDELESQWLDNLRKRHKVAINQKELKKLRKSLSKKP